jgi:hydrogenase maturation protease
MTVQLSQQAYNKNSALPGMQATKTLIVGLGNPILSDDGAGIYIARKIRETITAEQATIVEASIAGFSLLDLLIGYDKVIIIDAIQSSNGKAGQIYRLVPDSFSSSLHSTSPHDVDLTTALEFGKQLGLPVPEEIIFFAIEAADISTFNEECTPEVSKAIDKCAEMIVAEITFTNNKALEKSFFTVV